MYFEKFPKIYYDFNIRDENQLLILKDITTNIRFKKEVIENVTLWEYYDIQDGETPEIISEKFYGTPQYHWIIMLLNQRYDYINDFPLSYNELSKHITFKYGAGNENATHHYVDSDGYIVDSTTVGATPVSNAQYEEQENEKKRRIKIISSSLLSRILDEFETLI